MYMKTDARPHNHSQKGTEKLLLDMLGFRYGRYDAIRRDEVVNITKVTVEGEA